MIEEEATVAPALLLRVVANRGRASLLQEVGV